MIWVQVKDKRFIYKCFKHGIYIYEVKDNWYKINAHDLNKVKIYFSVKKTSLDGIPLLKKKIHQRHIFLFSLVIGLIILFFLSHIMVSVEVIHSDKNIRELVTKELKSLGIKENSFRKSYQEIEEIKEQILSAYPNLLEWIEIEVKGMKYIVRVEERVIEEITEEADACDIVASKDGMVKYLVYSTGEALVSENTSVKEGDILISGNIYNGEEIVFTTCAKGDVYAEVWYKVSVTIPLTYTLEEKTKKTRWNIKIDDSYLLKPRVNPYVDESLSSFNLFGKNISFVRQIETTETIESYTEEEALNKALEEVDLKINATLDEKESILDKKVLKNEVNDSTMVVEVFVVVLENIATTREISKGDQ